VTIKWLKKVTQESGGHRLCSLEANTNIEKQGGEVEQNQRGGEVELNQQDIGYVMMTSQTNGKERW